MSNPNHPAGKPPGLTGADEATKVPHRLEGVSFDFKKVSKHAPLTSHGTYLEGLNEGLEPLEEYQDGGYHPIHLDDFLGPSSRYRVIHKLGSGGFGTVWLCRDEECSQYVAIKVMVGDVDADSLPDLTLSNLDHSIAGSKHIAIPLDSFVTEGPNGVHQCVVLPVLGPCVSPNLWLRLEDDPASMLRRMAYQTALALSFLHKQGLCHGDFRPSNILVKLASLDDLPEEKLLTLLGEPQKVNIRTESGEAPPKSSPRYLVRPADISRLGNEFLTGDICIIDFGESFHISSPPEDLGIPENYLPPELLLDQEGAVGIGCDLWALGCTLFEIRQQLPLFYMIFDRDDMVAEIVRFFGKPSQSLWDSWEARPDFFDDEGVYLRSRSSDNWSLEVALSKSIEAFPPGADQENTTRKTLSSSPKEQELMADLLYKIFRYEPEQRLSADETLAHEWFKMGGISERTM